MAKRGRKPAAPEIKIAAGTRASRVNATAPKALPDRPECPAHLAKDAVAKAEWDRMADLLAKQGILSTTDGSALALYCSAFSRWVAAERQIEKKGMTVSAGHGAEKVSPYVVISNAAQAQMAKLLVEFGATPSSRGRVSQIGDAGPKDELAEYLAKRKKVK